MGFWSYGGKTLGGGFSPPSPVRKGVKRDYLRGFQKTRPAEGILRSVLITKSIICEEEKDYIELPSSGNGVQKILIKTFIPGFEQSEQTLFPSTANIRSTSVTGL